MLHFRRALPRRGSNGDSMKSRSALLLAATLLAACAQREAARPDGTTYPRNRVANVTRQIAIGVPGVTIPYAKTEEGDTAETTLYLLPLAQGQDSEQTLLARVPEVGQSRCGGPFRVSATKYFYGTEATLAAFNIYTPALRVTYRCPAITAATYTPHPGIERLPGLFSDHMFFDVMWKSYNLPPDRLQEAFRRFVAQQNMPIVGQGTSGGAPYLLAGRDPNEMRWGRIERVAAMFPGSGATSQLVMKHFSYMFTYHERGVMDTRRPSDLRGAQPWDRKMAFQRASEFLAAFEATLPAR